MIIKHEHFDLLGKTVLERIVFKPPFRADSSMHNEACFLYVVNGNSRLYGAQQSLPLNTGEAVVMKCGNYLNDWTKNDSPEPNEAVAVHFTPDLLKLVYDDQLPEFLYAKNPPKTPSIGSVQTNLIIEKYVENLLFYFNNPPLVTDELIKLKVKELILLLIQTDAQNNIKPILRTLFNKEQYEFKNVIHTHLYENLSVEDLALLTNLSLASFKRKFKSIFNDTPARYIKNKKLEKAAELLLATDKPRITDICFDCGFNDLAHFSKCFAIKYGCAPSEYKRQAVGLR